MAAGVVIGLPNGGDPGGMPGMVRPRTPLVLAVLLVLLGGCGGAAHGPAAGDQPPVSLGPSAGPAERAAALAGQLSDQDLVGQVLVPYAYGSDATKVSTDSAVGNQKLAGVDTPAEMIAKYRLGGLILVGFSADDPTAGTNVTTNVDSAGQVRQLSTGLQAAAGSLPAKVPLLIGTDQEYGVVTRLKSGVTQLPSAMAMGAAGSPALTEQAWAAAGRDLASVGLNVDFAPDADVLGSTGGGVIGSRSFGADPTQVASQVTAAVKGLHEGGLASTIKHFPGHGHTNTDSHTNLPVLSQTRGQLESGDLPPFQSGIAAGTDMIMSGHLDVQAIDPGVPASFSSKVLIDLLRRQLGFTGVVITDALDMAPAEKWSPGDAAVRALLAGNDMLLEPPDVAAAQRGLLDALHSGKLPRSRLIEAVTRILTVKFRIATWPKPGGMSTVGGADRQAAAGTVAAAAVTVLKGGCSGPLVTGPVRVTTSGGHDQQRTWLTAALRAAGVTVVSSGGTEVHLVGYGDGDGDLSAGARVTVAMDTPYLLSDAASSIRLATYSSTQAAMTGLAAVLAGKAKATGHSPVTVPGLPRSAC
jgi:beta-N-acetylhexosaminidase